MSDTSEIGINVEQPPSPRRTATVGWAILAIAAQVALGGSAMAGPSGLCGSGCLRRDGVRHRHPDADSLCCSPTRRGHRPPRSQARQRDGDRQRAPEGARLRAGETDGGRRRRERDDRDGETADRRRHHRRHGLVYVAGTGGRQEGRRAVRHLFVRLGLGRNGHWPAGVLGGDEALDHVSNLAAGAGVHRGCSPRTREDHRAVPAQIR